MKPLNTIITNCFIVSIFILSACNQSVVKNNVHIQKSKKLAFTSPFKAIKNPEETFVIQPNISQVITTKNGSKIIIDSLSLVDKQGNQISEPVTLHLQAMMDPAEIFTSGVPMKYSDNDITEVPFQSAGMFDIQAATNSGLKVTIDKKHPIIMHLSSSSNENGFSNYYLDKTTGVWKKTEEETKIGNIDKVKLRRKLVQLKGRTAFNNELFVLDFYNLLDEFLSNDYTAIHSYSDNPKKALPKRLLKYGIDAHNIISYDQVELNNNKQPACYIVWESVDRKKFPSWKMSTLAKVAKKEKDIYEITCSNPSNKNDIFTALIRPKMTIRSLLKFGPEKWDSNYAETLKEIQEHERTLAKMQDLYRVLTIRNFGVYNCDRFYQNPDAFEVQVAYDIPKGKNGFLPDRYFYISKRDKISIDYPFTKKIFLCKDETAVLYTVLEGDILAKVDADQLLRCNKDDKSIHVLKFIPITKINNTSELKNLIGI